MTTLPAIAAAAGPRLARHLDRLHDTLEHLGERLREAVVEAVGRAVADAVRAEVQNLLDVSPGPPPRPSYQPSLPSRQPTGLWGSSAASTWPYEREEPDYSAGMPLHHYQDELLEEDDYRPAPAQPPKPRSQQWGVALAAGLKAAGWWLGRRPSKNSVMTAIGVGLATGIAALVGSPLAAAVVGVAASGLALLSVADTARSGAAAVAREHH
jgi:hypothetical protein